MRLLSRRQEQLLLLIHGCWLPAHDLWRSTKMPRGSVHTTLQRLEKAGLVVSQPETVVGAIRWSRMYTTSDAGRKALELSSAVRKCIREAANG